MVTKAENLEMKSISFIRFPKMGIHEYKTEFYSVILEKIKK